MGNIIASAAQDLRTLALYNPKLAYMLTRGQPMEQQFLDIEVQFDSTATDQLKRGAMFSDKMFQFFWVQHIFYTIRRPTYNAGVFGAREQDEYAKRNPYIDIYFRITGEEKFYLTQEMTPIEAIADPAGTVHPREYDIVFTENSNVSIDMQNTREFAGEEVPYIVRMTFVGKQLSGCQLPGCGWDEVVCQLRKEGLYPNPQDDAFRTK